jgi:hypothetical protein
MKKLAAAVVVAASVVLSASEAHSIGAFLSYWNGKDTDNGYGVGISHQIKIIPIVRAELRGSWLSYGDSDLDLIPLEGLVRVNLGLFYVGAGGGYYIFSGSGDVDWDNAWGTFGLAGAGLSVAKIGLFGELKYTWVETQMTKPAERDADASGIGVNVGVVLNWF